MLRNGWQWNQRILQSVNCFKRPLKKTMQEFLMLLVTVKERFINRSRRNTASSYLTLTFKPKIAVSNSEKSASVNVDFKKSLESTHAEIRWAIYITISLPFASHSFLYISFSYISLFSPLSLVSCCTIYSPEQY